MLALTVYDVVLSLHVMAIVAAFGVVFTYPVVLPWLRRHHRSSMAVAHQVQVRLGRFVIAPAATVALLTGAYLATDAKLWSAAYVTIAFVILLAILGLGGAVLTPTERRLAELASGGVESPEYDAAFTRVMPLYVAVAVAVLVAVFVMVTRVGA